MKNTKRLKELFAAAMAISVAAASVFAPGMQEPVYATDNAEASQEAEAAGMTTEDTPVSDVTADKIIAHGGGSIKGFETTNSQEAVEKAIADGYRYIELDMDMSSDNKIIMIHDWDKTAEHYFGCDFDEKLTAQEFSKILVNGSFKTLTFDSLVKILDGAKEKGITDIKIITDTKGDNIGLLTAIAEQYPEYVGYIIPQIYNYSEYETVKALGYENIYLTLYMMENINYNQLLNFVKTNSIDAVVIGTDYYVKGIDTKLAAAGIKVYCHPVNDYEEARNLMKKGIYGVYSSFLLPREFTGASSKYYLEQTNTYGQKEKLTDVNLGALTADYIKSITLNGIVGGEMLHYEFDGATMEDAILAKAQDGIHKLTIDVFKPENTRAPYTTLTYCVWKCGDDLRLTDTKYEYRLEELKPLPEFEAVMAGEAVNSAVNIRSIGEDNLAKIKEILSKSLIVKKGQYYYYNDGKLDCYYVGEELLNVQSYSNGMTAIPIADTVSALGATWVDMDIAKYIYVTMTDNDPAYVTMSGGYYVNQGVKSLRMRCKIEIYRRKALAPEEYFSFITGRPYIDNEDMAILLPAGTKLTKDDAADVVKIASELY